MNFRCCYDAGYAADQFGLARHSSTGDDVLTNGTKIENALEISDELRGSARKAAPTARLELRIRPADLR